VTARGAIRRAAPVGPTGRAAAAVVAVAIVVTALVVTPGCSGDGTGRSDGEGTDAATVGSSLPPTSATTVLPVATTKVTPGPGQRYTVWYLRDGRLSPGEVRTTVTGEGPGELLRALVEGPTEADRGLGLQTGVQRNVEVFSIEQQGDTLVVGFNRAIETAQTRPQVAQVVWLLTQLPGVERVQFLVDGRPNGATGVPPISRADLDDVSAPVMVDDPLPAAVLGAGPIVATGTVAPGATVGWRLEDGFGTPLASGAADELASSPGSDGRTAWRFTAPVADGTAGVVRLVVFDTSAGQEVFPQVIPVTVGGPPPGP
jgi:hypothetical protein